ncbi:hypothetical protein WMY93_022687 [Mugilogobius chulae]|uniref:Uncharacterized protein n=1 Tax=Mugilogobius chulae TaxID=88201 RepID=A0AAW0N7M2_9GOBI
MYLAGLCVGVFVDTKDSLSLSSGFSSDSSSDSEHSDFCQSDQQDVACQDSKDHHFASIEEKYLREELDQSLMLLKEHLEKAKDGQQMLLVIADCIRKQSHQTKRQIQDQFNKLHLFLEEEEEMRLRALREEEEQKFQKMKDKMSTVSKEIELLSETIRATEEQLRATDVSFHLMYKEAVERMQRCAVLEEPKLGPGALIDQAKHLGNLTFNIWSNMKAWHDLTSFTTEKQRRPNEAETDTDWALVLGSEGIDCGSMSWGVEVGNSGEWAVGVLTDCFERDARRTTWKAGAWLSRTMNMQPF